MSFILLFKYAFLTFFIEAIIFALVYRKKISLKYIIKISFLVNFITNLTLNGILSYLGDYGQSEFIYIIIGEIAVLVLEYMMYVYAFGPFIDNKKISPMVLLLMTLVANVCSFCFGLLWLFM